MCYGALKSERTLPTFDPRLRNEHKLLMFEYIIMWGQVLSSKYLAYHPVGLAEYRVFLFFNLG